MNPESFIIWLSGFLDAAGDALTAEQIAELKATADSVQMRGPFRRMQDDMKMQRAQHKAAKAAKAAVV